jgi:hypothetical protein
LTWSLVIMDDGITNAFQNRVGKAVAREYDYYSDFPDTGGGVRRTHANFVFQAALEVSLAYDVVDIKVATSRISASYEPLAIEAALRDLLATPDDRIGAINMSFGGGFFPFTFADEISSLAARGILCVAASGNSGTHARLERPLHPAALAEVIAVGSHDGSGRPTEFSNNGAKIAVLADGQDQPVAGINGTSFAAPQVAATVTHAQAIVVGLTGAPIGVAQMVDVLQQGGSGPRSRPDPGDGQTRYFLHDHAGSLDYAWNRYGGSPTVALEYVASHADLIAAIGADARRGQLHFERTGAIEERGTAFDALDYLASYPDLIRAFGADGYQAASHYIVAGGPEGRSVTFDGLDYIASYGDLIRAFGPAERSGTAHYLQHGFAEGRSVTFDGLEYIASYPDLILAFGADDDAGAMHYIVAGNREGRATDRFDTAQYLANYRDLQAAFGADEAAATQHFVTNGFFEDRTDHALAASDFIV